LTIRQIRYGVLSLWALAAAWFFLWPSPQYSSEPTSAGQLADGRDLYWYKGNTHSHAKISVGDYDHGDSSPGEVAKWYRQHGYHFVAITDHNRFEDARDLNNEGDESLLVIAGMEVTSDYLYPGVNQQGERRIHASAINIDTELEWDFDDADKSAIIRLQAERTNIQNGLHILNHPNYRFQLELKDIVAAENISHMEIYNAHPRSNHAGHAGFRPGIERLWDQLLSTDQLVYGVASDDAHDFKWYRQWLRYFGAAPPGGAWVMVQSPDFSASGITAAIQDGNFYSSTGVHLRSIEAGERIYTVELDRENTIRETSHRWVRAAAPVVPSDDSHFVIEFIGRHGRVLYAVHNQDVATFRPDQNMGYIRAKVTYLDKIYSPTGADRARAYYAWTQPVMTDTGQSD
jgi:hypothetical protein